VLGSLPDLMNEKENTEKQRVYAFRIPRPGHPSWSDSTKRNSCSVCGFPFLSAGSLCERCEEERAAKLRSIRNVIARTVFDDLFNPAHRCMKTIERDGPSYSASRKAVWLFGELIDEETHAALEASKNAINDESTLDKLVIGNYPPLPA